MNDRNQNTDQNQDQSPYIIEAASPGISRFRAVGLVAGGVAVCAALIGGSAFAMNAVSAPAEQSSVQQDSSNRLSQEAGSSDGETDSVNNVVDGSTNSTDGSTNSTDGSTNVIDGSQSGPSSDGTSVQDPTNSSNPVTPTQDPGTSVAVPPISFGGGDDGDDQSADGQSDDNSTFNSGGQFSSGDDGDSNEQESDQSDD